MTRAYLAFTAKGLALAEKLAAEYPGSVARCGHEAGICRRQFLGQCKALCRKGQIGAGHWSVPLRNSVVKAGS